MEETPSSTGASRPSRAASSKKPARSSTSGQAGNRAVRRTVKNLPGASSTPKPVKTSSFHGFVSVQSRGTVALPPVLRKRYGLDKPGSQVEITERSDGVLELRPAIAVPASQAWFWAENWQEGERRADADIAAGRTTTYDNVDDFMDSLDIDE
jgi:bifunctional DNA-binding transcriptional regulator/antitoxin component of YhaV-PrlF toxin-antitoxin module